MDGLLYAAMSHNMSNGLGSFWAPYLSNSVFPEFYEHPPLALGLQSLWFRVFGSSIQVERFYSLFVYFLSALGTVLCWKELGQKLKTGWIPLLFWFLVSNVIWALSNNMLENTMTVFVVFAAYFSFKGTNKSQLGYFVLAGICLSLATLTKGFVGLYIWALPFAFFVFQRNMTFFSMISRTLVLIIFTSLPIVILALFSEAALHNFTSYINNQVFKSIETVVTVNSRFHIFWEFLQHIIAPLIFGILLIYFGKKSVNLKHYLNANKKTFLVLGFLLFCGIAPIMISLKQSGFYILTIYPFFGLLMGLICLPILENWTIKIVDNPKKFRILKVAAIVLVLLVTIFSASQINSLGRDKSEINDAHLVINYVGSGAEIDICNSQFGNWSKHGYYSRYGTITLLRNKEKNASFYLVTKDECIPDKNLYQQINLELMNHTLYQKK